MSEELVEPLRDTWTLKDEAFWSLRPFRRPESDAPAHVNAWCGEMVATALRALEGLARAWSLEFDVAGLGPPVREVVPLESADPRRVLAEHRGVVTGVCARLDLHAWVRVVPGGPPVRAWVRLPVRLDVFTGDDPWLTLSFAHGLFAFAPGAQRELHELNAPLLAAALQRWEQFCGDVFDFGGAGVTRDGYRRS